MSVGDQFKCMLSENARVTETDVDKRRLIQFCCESKYKSGRLIEACIKRSAVENQLESPTDPLDDLREAFEKEKHLLATAKPETNGVLPLGKIYVQVCPAEDVAPLNTDTMLDVTDDATVQDAMKRVATNEKLTLSGSRCFAAFVAKESDLSSIGARMMTNTLCTVAEGVSAMNPDNTHMQAAEKRLYEENYKNMTWSQWTKKHTSAITTSAWSYLQSTGLTVKQWIHSSPLIIVLFNKIFSYGRMYVCTLATSFTHALSMLWSSGRSVFDALISSLTTATHLLLGMVSRGIHRLVGPQIQPLALAGTAATEAMTSAFGTIGSALSSMGQFVVNHFSKSLEKVQIWYTDTLGYNLNKVNKSSVAVLMNSVFSPEAQNITIPSSNTTTALTIAQKQSGGTLSGFSFAIQGVQGVIQLLSRFVNKKVSVILGVCLSIGYMSRKCVQAEEQLQQQRHSQSRREHMSLLLKKARHFLNPSFDLVDNELKPVSYVKPRSLRERGEFLVHKKLRSSRPLRFAACMIKNGIKRLQETHNHILDEFDDQTTGEITRHPVYTTACNFLIHCVGVKENIARAFLQEESDQKYFNFFSDETYLSDMCNTNIMKWYMDWMLLPNLFKRSDIFDSNLLETCKTHCDPSSYIQLFETQEGINDIFAIGGYLLHEKWREVYTLREQAITKWQEDEAFMTNCAFLNDFKVEFAQFQHRQIKQSTTTDEEVRFLKVLKDAKSIYRPILLKFHPDRIKHESHAFKILHDMNTGADNAKTDDELKKLVSTWDHEINLLEKIKKAIRELAQKVDPTLN